MDRDLTVRAYACSWLGEVRSRSHPATLERYEREYRLYIDPVLGGRKLSDVGRPDVRALVSRHCGEGLKPQMLLRVLANLFSAAYEDGLIVSQPAQRLWKQFRGTRTTLTDVKAFTKDELSRFLELSATEPLYAEFFETMAFTGARSGEARSLQVGDVHPVSRKLDIIRTFSGNRLSASTKTKAARRIEIPQALAELLGRRARGREPSAWLFHRGGGEPFNARAVSQAFRRILRRAALPLHHGTHSLRHTYASHLLEQGVPIVYVQAQLGHRSIQQTVDVYGRWLTVSRAPELERFVAGVRQDGNGNVPRCGAAPGGNASPGTRCSAISECRALEQASRVTPPTGTGRPGATDSNSGCKS